MQLQKSGNFLTALVIVLLMLACISVGLALMFNREHRSALQQMHDIQDSLSQLQAATHALTQSVHSYAVTNNDRYYDQYLYEKTIARRADTALDGFTAHSLIPGEVTLLLKIKQQSLLLEHLEMDALLQAREGRWEQAVQLLFGKDYQTAVGTTIGALQELQLSVRQRTDVRVGELDQQSRWAGILAMVLVVISLLLVLLVLRSFFIKRVLRPVLQLTAAVHRQSRGEAVALHTSSADAEEIRELVRAVQQAGDALRDIEQERQRFSEAERWYRQIIEFAPDGMLVVDASGVIQIANPKAHAQFGYPPGTLTGVTVEQLIPPSIRAGHVRQREAFMKSTAHRAMDSINGNFRALHASGREFPVELGLTRLPLVEGRSECTCVTVRDITDRKQYEQTIADQLEFQRVLLDTLPYPVFVKDSDARYVGFNQAFLDFFGVSRDSLIGKTVLQFLTLPAQDRAMYQEANERILKDGGHYLAEIDIPDAAGVLHPVLYALASYNGSDGRIAGLVGTLIDITAQKEAQQAQTEARTLAEETTRLKSDFLANMSHEIRTPMNVIMGMAHLALSTGLDKKQRNYVEKISAAAQGLLGIINDILDFSKIEAGKMHLERAEFCLEDVLSGLMDMTMLRAQDKGLELLFDIGTDVPGGLIGDSLRLSQVLNNLLGNAIKFTRRGEVRLSIHTEQRQDDQVWLRFDVTDTGIGMSPEQTARLFRAFSQADSSTSRQFGGTGLGLVISKRLVNLMDGEIGVDSEPGVGTTFWFRLPFGIQQEQRELTIDSADLLGMKVLVVDDNASAREIFQTLLQSLKFRTECAGSAEEALAVLQQADAREPFRLVLLDWMMPGMDGVVMLRRLAQQTEAGRLPRVIMVTAYSRDDLLEQLQDIPVAGILEKPVTPSNLLDAILNAFGRDGLRRPLRTPLAGDAGQARAALSGSYVLLVEDNEINQEMTIEILAQAGIRTDVASNGAEALSLVAQNSYDAVLMDCQMPVMDGFEATRRIRAQERFRSLPVLAMTANAMESDKEQCRAAGMDDHIAKPLDVQQLFLTLQRWIKPSLPLAAARTLTPTKPLPLPEVDGLQTDVALQRLGGNHDLLLKLLRRFCETQQDVIAAVRQALSSGAQNDAIRLTHTLKGLTGNIGAASLSRKAAQLEALLRHAGQDDPEPLLSEIGSDVGILIRSLQSCLQPPADVPPPDGDPAAGIPDLQPLARLLAEADGEAGEYFHRIQPALQQLGLGELAGQIGKHLSRYEFEQAAGLLTELQHQLPETPHE